MTNKADKLQMQCDAWNVLNPIGIEVIVQRDNGECMRTKTTSQAEVLSGHSAVIWMEGVRGCYLLSRVKPAIDTSFERAMFPSATEISEL